MPRPAGALLDRLIRGRLWIGLLAFSLIGIVAMQLVVLKLNTGIGRTLTREATLQRENAQLGIEDSMYSAETRVAPLAAEDGMTLAPPGSVHFVQAASADISRAAGALAQPIQPQVEATSAASTSEAPTSASTGETPGSTVASGETTASTATTGNEPTAGTSTTAESSSAGETGGSSEAAESSATSTGG